ncbi:MAG: hypothetical protein FWB76_00555, partial [Oscillospiraceae bacterium]|nr:hypothetical protein [Oscillospiraceae bacterium]
QRLLQALWQELVQGLLQGVELAQQELAQQHELPPGISIIVKTPSMAMFHAIICGRGESG